jgi:4-hydroxybenzoate polyprenyltransferase
VIAWLKLLRLPNVFTAVADVTMGYLVTQRELQPASHVAFLVAASCLLYLSGMVLNDVFDAEADARDRPDRPIPSGRVPLRSATAAGWAMLASGVLVAWYASFLADDLRPGVIAMILAAAIVLYDGVLKRTPLALLLMGACRGLNVLLGMSLAVQHPAVFPSLRQMAARLDPDLPWRWWTDHEWLIVLGVGTYVVGVTVFARTDAHTSSRGRLFAGLAIILAGMGLLAAIPALTGYSLVIKRGGWYLLWAVLALITARRCLMAVLQPDPQRVQSAVRHCVQSIIVLDAAVCVGFAGPYWGLIVLSLLFPTILLTIWLQAT